METPKSRFHIGGKAKSYCRTSQFVPIAAEKSQLADPPVKDRTLIPRLALLLMGLMPKGGEFKKRKKSRTRITPPCLPGRFCDCLERLRIKEVEQYYIPNGILSITGCQHHGLSTPFPQDPYFTPKKRVVCTGFADYSVHSSLGDDPPRGFAEDWQVSLADSRGSGHYSR
jgi:hypothetical protein